MSLRQQLNNPIVAAVCGGLAVILLAWYFLFSGSSTPEQGKAWYYDLEKSEKFIAESGKIPPFDRDGGGEAVRLHVFSCGDCEDESTHFNGYLERYVGKAHEAAKNADSVTDPAERQRLAEQIAVGREVRLIETGAWANFDSAAGQSIVRSVNDRCEEGDALECQPLD